MRKSSSLYLVLGIVAVVIFAALLAFILYRRKKQREEISIIDDFEVSDEKEDSEPDYQDYLRNKKKREKEVSVN